jgi:hypothetical protein
MTTTLLLTLMIAHPEHPAVGWFRTGVEQRDDAALAQESFRKAAESISGETPHALQAKGRALALAGQAPEAIRHFHRGLMLAPDHRGIQEDLREIRATIRYPEPGDPALRVRPNGFEALRHRVSPMELLAFAGVSGTVCAISFIRFRTSRSTGSLVIVIVGGIGFATAFMLGRWIAVEVPSPLVVVQPAILRTGNGASYPAKLELALPAGAEVHELGRRGGWVHVELPGGAAGWLPEANVAN